MLFSCYIEDDIASLGRCHSLELLGYFSRQAYFIRCGQCEEGDSVPIELILPTPNNDQEIEEEEMAIEESINNNQRLAHIDDGWAIGGGVTHEDGRPTMMIRIKKVSV